MEPTRRLVRAPGGVLLAMITVVACAPQPRPAQPRQAGAELGHLRDALVARDETIRQLEGRLALLEAAQRELREQLREAGEQARPRESVRIGAASSPAPSESNEERLARTGGRPQASEPRPLLRLHGSHAESGARAQQRAFAAEAAALPPLHERLKVVPLPSAMPDMAEAVGPEQAAKVAPPDDAEALYARALGWLERRQHGEALRELESFVRLHPAHPHAPRAHFQRGELLFAEREYTRALVAFELSLKRAEGEQAAECLLRIARCHRQLGSPERARERVAELRARYPESAAARRVDLLMQEDS